MANNKNPIDGSKEEAQSKENSKAQPKAKNAGATGVVSEDQLKKNSEGQPSPKEEESLVGKGPKPIGPNQQTWDNPEPGEELKKEIDEQLNKLKKLGENPTGQDPEIDKLN